MNAPFRQPDLDYRAFILRLHEQVSDRLKDATFGKRNTLLVILRLLEGDLSGNIFPP